MKASFVVALVASSFLGALALQAMDLGHAPWYISRASGLVAFALLTGAMITGLLVTTRAAEPGMPRPLSFDLHQFLSMLSLTFLAVHAGSLLFDGFLRFAPLDLLIPFSGPYRSFWTGLGVLSAWGTALVTASFWIRKQVGQRAWRRFHYLSFGAYVAGLAHGIGAGTDTALPAVHWLYVLSAASVAALLAYRVAALKLAAARPSARRPVSARR